MQLALREAHHRVAVAVRHFHLDLLFFDNFVDQRLDFRFFLGRNLVLDFGPEPAPPPFFLFLLLQLLFVRVFPDERAHRLLHDLEVQAQQNVLVESQPPLVEFLRLHVLFFQIEKDLLQAGLQKGLCLLAQHQNAFDAGALRILGDDFPRRKPEILPQ